MADDDANYMRLLIESLEILATDPQDQIAYIDRVGLEFDDLAEDHVAPARNAYWMCEEGLISPEVKERTERIDAVFTSIGGPHNAHRWTDQALSDDPAWIEIRTLAREALGLLKTESSA